MKINAGHILTALARHFDWWQNTIIPEWEIDGGRADLLILSRRNYLTEIEIKVTMADWNCDRDKNKWKRERPHIARFFYAIPENLKDRVPEWVPPSAGILSVRWHPGYERAHVSLVRNAKRQPKAQHAPDGLVAKVHESCYYRFWRREVSVRWHEQLKQQRQDEAKIQAKTVGLGA